MGEKPSRGRKEEDAWHGMPLHATMKRVKVYRLEDNGKWDDQGTGHVTIDYIEGSRELVLAVVDEEDNDTLLLHNITPDDIYRKQEERIISWRDPEKALELALSFQEAEGCSFIWENMRNIREDAQSKILSCKSSSSVNGDLKKLPPPEMPSLSVILKTMQCGTTEQKQLITNSISKDVVSFLKDNAAFIQDLFERRKSSNVSSKNELVFFLRKFCNVSKSLQPDQQITLSRDLANQGVFDIVSDVLQSQDKVLVSAGTDILLYFLTQDPDLLRSYIANHGEKSGEDISLLGLLFKRMVTDFSGEMLCQFLEILRILLDAVNNSAVVKIFYKKYFERLIDIIESSCPPKSIAGSTFGSVGVVTSFEMVTICDFLCFCVVKHPCMTKINFLKSYSIKKILTLTRRREKVLVVAAVRFIRTVIGTNDELLTSLVIKFNMLKPIIEAFVENGDRDNLLQSTALELFEYITKENRKSLIVYVVGSFWNQLVKFEQREIIQAFRLKYEEIRNSTETEETTSVGHMRKKADERGLDKEEEDCFNTDSNHEDSATQTTQVQQRCMVKPAGGSEIRHIPARPKSGGLMDHDDDKYYNRPPKRPVEADETFNTLTARHRSLDGKDIDGNILKKSKLEARVSFSKINVLANVVGKHSDLEDTQPPLIPASSTISSDGNDGAREASPGSPNLQPPESFDYLAGDSSSEMVVATAETADSDPCPFSL